MVVVVVVQPYSQKYTREQFVFYVAPGPGHRLAPDRQPLRGDSSLMALRCHCMLYSCVKCLVVLEAIGEIVCASFSAAAAVAVASAVAPVAVSHGPRDKDGEKERLCDVVFGLLPRNVFFFFALHRCPGATLRFQALLAMVMQVMVGRLKHAGFITGGADGRIRGKRNYRWHGKVRGGLFF